MKVQDVPDSIWSNVLLGKRDVNFQFLAVQILLSRLRLNLQRDSSPVQVQGYISELKNFFAKNENLPPVQEDLKKIMGGLS